MYRRWSVNGLGLSFTFSGQCQGRRRFSSITRIEAGLGSVQEDSSVLLEWQHPQAHLSLSVSVVL